MSEPATKADLSSLAVAVLIVIMLIITAISSDHVQIRDLQRRVGQLEVKETTNGRR